MAPLVNAISRIIARGDDGKFFCCLTIVRKKANSTARIARKPEQTFHGLIPESFQPGGLPVRKPFGWVTGHTQG